MIKKANNYIVIPLSIYILKINCSIELYQLLTNAVNNF